MSKGIDRILEPHVVPLTGDVQVRRVLPRGGRGIGPFIFLDHMGPWEYVPGISNVDVAPHPHIGLSTLTYLFSGSIVHRDSLGSVQVIQPGAVNWMTAGRGVVHSERLSPELKTQKHEIHGLQAWVSLPEAQEKAAPSFVHHEASAIPEFSVNGARVRLIAGQAFGQRSPVQVFSKLFYMIVDIPAGVDFEFFAENQEMGLYLLSGSLEIEDQSISHPELLLFNPGAQLKTRASKDSRALVLGGESLGPRKIWWNFVATTQETIEAAKTAWRADIFPRVPGETERIPLPEPKT